MGILSQTPWRECGSCHRIVRGDDCYKNHCHPNKQGESICQKYYKCMHCKKVMSHHRRKPEDHQCGEVMCLNCQTFVNPNNHLCYMKPVKVNEGNRKKKDSGEGVDDSAEESTDEDDGDNEEHEYLFFNIESRQKQGQL